MRNGGECLDYLTLQSWSEGIFFPVHSEYCSSLYSFSMQILLWNYPVLLFLLLDISVYLFKTSSLAFSLLTEHKNCCFCFTNAQILNKFI